MDQILIYLVFPLIYVTIGGLFVYWITTRLQEKRELANNKIEIFNALYSTRSNTVDYQSWKSLCTIPVVFRENLEIINAYYEYITASNVSQQIGENDKEYALRVQKNLDKMDLARVKMLKAIAVECKLIKNGDELVIDYYCPQWLMENNRTYNNNYKISEMQVEILKNQIKEKINYGKED